MDTQNDVAYYYRRAAEARARGREALAQSMENYARNLEAGIYNDNGRGVNIGDWAKRETPQQQTATRRSNEDALYEKARPAMAPAVKPRKSYSQPPRMSGYGPGYSEPLEYEAPKTGPGYSEPPMDYPVVPQGGYQPQQSGHTGAVKFFDDGADVEAWKRAHPEPETPRNKYGATKGSFLDYLQSGYDEGQKRYDW